MTATTVTDRRYTMKIQNSKFVILSAPLAGGRDRKRRRFAWRAALGSLLGFLGFSLAGCNPAAGGDLRFQISNLKGESLAVEIDGRPSK